MCESDDIPLEQCLEAAARRFADHDELLYSLRSVDEHMPWVRYVWIVTNGQTPSWLNLTHPKIRMVDHKDIFKWPEHLPTFNSLAIEAHIHLIPGLSEHFIYFNDDMMLASKVYPSTWYTQAGGQKLWFFWPLAQHPDVPYEKTPLYFRNKRCPQCECPEASVEKDVDAKAILQSLSQVTAPPRDAKAPYYTKEVGDEQPEQIDMISFDMKKAGRTGIDFKPPEPWQREPTQEASKTTEKEQEKESTSTGRQELGYSRKLMASDSVRQSLLKTHKLMHETFGYGDRMEPSHLPIYIQKDIMKRLRSRFPEEYYDVSSHRFREATDMHFHFSYSYFLMHEREEFDFTAIFSSFDSDHSLILESRELYRLATNVLLGLHKRQNGYRSPPLANNWASLLVKDCAFAEHRLVTPWATREELETCPSAMDLITSWYSHRLRNRFEIGSDHLDSKFLQVGTNFELKREIEHIYVNEPKFVCLNDDIDYQDTIKAAAYLKLTSDFYRTMYPLPSSYERYDIPHA